MQSQARGARQARQVAELGERHRRRLWQPGELCQRRVDHLVREGGVAAHRLSLPGGTPTMGSDTAAAAHRAIDKNDCPAN